MYPRPTSTLSAHEQFARGAIGVAYKRYLGTHRVDDTRAAIEQFADVMTVDGTETFVGKSRADIVQILGERTAPSHSITRAASS
jgi:hypothetical protein